MKKIMALYIVTLIIFSIFTYFFIDPNLFYYRFLYTGIALQDRVVVSIVFIVFLILFYSLYIYFLYIVKSNFSLNIFKKLVGITVIILIFSYPAILSYDIFNYIVTSKVLYLYQENPYIIMPIELQDPMLSFTRATNKTALYGPIWLLLTAIPYFVGIFNFFITIISFKLLVSVFYIGTLVIMYKFTRNISHVVVFGLNPLVVIETLVSGHNDIVMIFFAVAAFYSIKNRKILAALVLFLLSIFIKYSTIFLFPVFIFLLWKTFTKSVISWERIFFFSTLSMGLIFLLSPLREEMYPWYAIWFLPFMIMSSSRKIMIHLSIVITFSLFLRYIPYMVTGNYFGTTPHWRTILTLIPLAIFSLYTVFQSKKYVRL